MGKSTTTSGTASGSGSGTRSRGQSRGGRRTLDNYTGDSKAPVSRPLVDADEYLAATEEGDGAPPADDTGTPPVEPPAADVPEQPHGGPDEQPDDAQGGAGGGHQDDVQDQDTEAPAGRTVVLLTAPGADVMGLPDTVTEVLAAELPDASAPPAEIIDGCERRIEAVLAVNDAIDQRKADFLLEFAGPAVRLAKATESWRHKVDPATGKAFRSFAAWRRYVRVSHAHAYRMVDEQPVAEALAPIYTGPLTGKQVDVLAPILRNHGDAAVRDTWETASKTGTPSAPKLARARDLLGYAINPEPPEDDDDGPGGELALRINPAKVNFGKVREVSRSAPNVWRAIARTILDEVGDDEEEDARD
ncbi:hypothetical protein [Streptomyces sp. NPDC049879]|uniref:hypothetical protein n=1 Tax=Streptomyces sp. NPDC049879 TaxID=3365598 RepID=UPI0037B0CAAF